MTPPLYEAAYPYADDALDLPVSDLDAAALFYGRAFGMKELERSAERVILARDQVRLGFCINGRDPEQEGAAIQVSDIHRAREELEERGIAIGNWRIDERDGQRLQVFFVVAPDGLCYYFHQQLEEDA